MGGTAEALPLFEEAITLNAADAGERGLVTLRSRDNLAGCYEQMGKLEEARRIHQHSLQIRTEDLGPLHTDTLISLVNLARLERALGHRERALGLYEKAIPAIETVRAQGDLSAENREAFFAKWADTYSAYAALLLASGKEEEAFRIGELSKARTLLKSTATRYANRSGVLAPEERERAEGFEQRIAKLDASLVEAAGEPERRLRTRSGEEQSSRGICHVPAGACLKTSEICPTHRC